jgi:hypothetical protein
VCILWSQPLAGGTPIERARVVGRGGKIFVDGEDVWWWTSFTILHVPAIGPTRVIAHTELPLDQADVALAPGFVYWLRQGESERSDGAIIVAPR